MEHKTPTKTVAQNKKALHDYFVLESYEAGIELCGTEVKSVRAGKVNLKDAWCSIVDGEMFVNGMHISPYDHGNIFNRDPLRVKKTADAQKRNHAPFGHDAAAGLNAYSPFGLFQKRAGESAGRSL